MEVNDGSSPDILASQILQRLGDIRAHLLSLAQTLDLDNAFGTLHIVSQIHDQVQAYHVRLLHSDQDTPAMNQKLSEMDKLKPSDWVYSSVT